MTAPSDIASHQDCSAVSGSVLRLVHRLRYGWTPFATEISELMESAADTIEEISNRDVAHREMARLQLANQQAEITRLREVIKTERDHLKANCVGLSSVERLTTALSPMNDQGHPARSK